MWLLIFGALRIIRKWSNDGISLYKKTSFISSDKTNLCQIPACEPFHAIGTYAFLILNNAESYGRHRQDISAYLFFFHMNMRQPLNVCGFDM